MYTDTKYLDVFPNMVLYMRFIKGHSISKFLRAKQNLYSKSDFFRQINKGRLYAPTF